MAEQEVTATSAKVQSGREFLETYMPLYDTRIYRKLSIFDGKSTHSTELYPHHDYGSYVTDYYTTPGSIVRDKESSNDKGQQKHFDNQKKGIEEFINKHHREYMGTRAFVHPYAIVKLAGASGAEEIVKGDYAYDFYTRRKFYEVDGENTFSGNYSKTPTTTALIKWGTESPRNKTPYCFQDFVFCKWWNKIENNRLITLRRYAAPVTDNIEFADYAAEETTALDEGTFTIKKPVKDSSGNLTGKFKEITMKPNDQKSAYTPLATAVTYFGDDTENKLSSLLQFSAKYNWDKLTSAKSPHDLTASQNDEGQDLIANDGTFLSTVSKGFSKISKLFGFFGEISGVPTINLDGATTAPPDPYSSGPYENRILGPVNVITNTYKRGRGLEFTGSGLKITFEYVARPIAGINNKAVLLDLLANMLLLTYSSGTWFGGMWRYRNNKPAIYPFKYGDTMNALYRGQIFGKDGAIDKLTKDIFADTKNSLTSVLPDIASALGNLVQGAANFLKSALTGDPSKKEEYKKRQEDAFKKLLNTETVGAIEKVLAAKALRGTSVPFIGNQRALLTGEPVGDWHLTIGNPFNPIAMIGNLIVTNLTITFNDELGPDDFPTGFKAVVDLEHGLGRDRDAIESMFNRGQGRIYTLDSHFRSSADGETKVDAYTGGENTPEGRTHYEEMRSTYFGGGTAFIAKIEQNPLQNKGKLTIMDTERMESLKPTSGLKGSFTIGNYFVDPWQMGYAL